MEHNQDKRRTSVFGSVVLAAAFALSQNVLASTSVDYEPCINGGVSENGLYVSQEQEDRARQLAFVDQISIRDELELEPCIDGGVSSSGLYVSQEAEDAMAERLAQVN
mgnify:CR=1 FL=1